MHMSYTKMDWSVWTDWGKEHLEQTELNIRTWKYQCISTGMNELRLSAGYEQIQIDKNWTANIQWLLFIETIYGQCSTERKVDNEK